MKPRTLALHAAALVALALFAAWNFLRIPPDDSPRHVRVHALIDRILLDDSQSEQAMLLLRTGMAAQYDDLTDDIRDLERALQALQRELADAPSVAGALRSLAASVALQGDAAEDFKSAIGVARVSSLYLPRLADQLARAHPRRALLINQYARDMLAWLQTPDDDALLARLRREELRLRQARLNDLTLHGAIIRRHATQADQAMNAAMNCGTPANVRAVNLAYDRLHDRVMQQRATVLSRVQHLAALLILWLGALLFALAQGQRHLMAANAKLHGIHERLRRNLRLREQAEQRLSRMFQESPAAIAMLDENGRMMQANPAALRMFAIADEERLRGRSLADLSPDMQPDGRASDEAAREWTEQAVQQGGAAFHWFFRRASGPSAFPCHVRLSVIRMDDETWIQAAITDLSEVEEAREEVMILAAALANMGEAVMITDSEARIEYVNPAFERLTGFSPAEAVGRFASMLRGDAHSDDFYRGICDELASGRSWSGEIVIRRKDGADIATFRTITPVPGRPDHQVTVMRDITREREEQQRREHAQRLESLGVMAGGIAHDFNNLLAAIMGNASLCRMKLGDHPATAHLERIEQASQSASELCRQMLDYAGKGSLERKPVNLSQMVREVLEMIRVSIGKQIELRLDLAPDMPPVMGDPGQLKQVLINLVINASEAIGDRRGRITIATCVSDAAARDMLAGQACMLPEPEAAARLTDPEATLALLRVEDTGCGMSAEVQRRLFDPFFTTKFTGRGLGMSAVLGIVRGHAGGICVRSEPGRGSSFTIALPAAPEAQDDEAAARGQVGASAPSFENRTVLVVDDEDVVREVASEILRSHGMRTLEARNGREAVDMYQRHHVDLVLLDMTMPDMDGRACAEALKKLDAQARIVIASGYSETSVAGRFPDMNIAGIIKKPWRPEALIDLLARALDA